MITLFKIISFSKIEKLRVHIVNIKRKQNIINSYKSLKEITNYKLKLTLIAN